jgi:hypothetical protein
VVYLKGSTEDAGGGAKTQTRGKINNSFNKKAEFL